MSACLILQQNDRCYMCSDSAVSSKVNGSYVRIRDDAKKIFEIDDMLIFCSGNMKIVNSIICNIYKSKNPSILKISEICKHNYCNCDSLLEMFVCKRSNESEISTFQISSYNKFDIIERVAKKGSTQLLSLGFNSDVNFNIFKNEVINGDNVLNIFEESFKKMSCNEVGGEISIYEYNTSIKLLKKTRVDNINIINKKFDTYNNYYLVGKTIVGEIILGEKLFITSELGEFYIGEMNDDAKGFGLSIKEGEVQRIFLGTELVNGVRKARLRLYDKNGQGLVLSEDGIISEFQFCDRSAVDNGSPMYSYFRIQNNVNILKECVLSLKLRPFRVYSKGVEGGGAYVQGLSSLNGGGSTSGGGGSYYEVVGSTSEYSSVSSSGMNYIGWSGNERTLEETPQHHYHDLYSSELHRHSVSVPINIPIHYHSTPSHQHTTNINIPNHTHSEKYGCFDLSGSDNNPSDVSIRINGQTVMNNINSDVELNITTYLLKGQMNEIIISSNTRGQIYFNLYNKAFVLW